MRQPQTRDQHCLPMHDSATFLATAPWSLCIFLQSVLFKSYRKKNNKTFFKTSSRQRWPLISDYIWRIARVPLVSISVWTFVYFFVYLSRSVGGSLLLTHKAVCTIWGSCGSGQGQQKSSFCCDHKLRTLWTPDLLLANTHKCYVHLCELCPQRDHHMVIN